jgi:hypothetical protein
VDVPNAWNVVLAIWYEFGMAEEMSASDCNDSGSWPMSTVAFPNAELVEHL